MLHDVLVAGGGPAGATLALALRDTRLAVRVLDARPAGGLGASDRTLALAHTARLIFERIGIWERLESVTAIEEIDISQRGGFGVTRLQAVEAGVPALGYVVRYGELQAALDQALADAGIALDFGCRVEAISATRDHATLVARVNGVPETHLTRLVVVADGSGDALPEIHRRKINYGQHALTARISAAAPRPGVAFERFTRDGPAALLPFEGGYALIWTATPARTAELQALGDADFLAALQAHFGERVGRFTAVAERKSFPLTLQFAQRVAAPRAVLLGNAAQALHPVAGQGFNLGLRDVWTLAAQLQQARPEDIGSTGQLDAYAKSRRVDRWAGVAFTHSLIQAFANDHPLAVASRGLGLTLLDSIPLLKHAFARTMLNGLR
ncbi:MAG: FAD-dependent monooxygenase [Betaproteobacteria bacterium]